MALLAASAMGRAMSLYARSMPTPACQLLSLCVLLSVSCATRLSISPASTARPLPALTCAPSVISLSAVMFRLPLLWTLLVWAVVVSRVSRTVEFAKSRPLPIRSRPPV
ncbi:hypothetical protein D3C86_1284020 [compost metagenome]